MKILSWNILANEFINKSYYPMIPADILFNRKKRQEQIIRTLKQAAADIMLLQEVMQSEYNTLYTEFHSAYYLIKGKYIQWQKNKRGHSGNVILLKKSIFVFKNHIQLDFGLAVECQLKSSKTLRPIIVINVHLDDLKQAKRIEQIKELEPLLAGQTHQKIILGGDFNEHYTPIAKLYKQLTRDYVFSLPPEQQEPTYYIERKMRIDNILVKGFEGKKESKVINDYGDDIIQQFLHYGSDHLPVTVFLK
jgi:endonuclease/exonuclease/phosphatase family metal-dependent hydrolase